MKASCCEDQLECTWAHFKLLLLHFHLFILYVSAHAMACVWQSEDNMLVHVTMWPGMATSSLPTETSYQPRTDFSL